MLNLVLALLAGVVTVAAPCTLPMLPILLGASVGQTGKIRPAMIALGFVISFSAAALALSAIPRVFDFDANSLRTGAAILLLGFGLLMIWPTPFEWLSIRISGLTNVGSAGAASRQGTIGGFVLGTTLGLVWTPCAGPVLGSILTVVATSRDTAWASVLLVVYPIGAALPMLAIAYGGQADGIDHKQHTRPCGVPGCRDHILPDRPDRPVINPPSQEIFMTIRSFAAAASVLALCLIGATSPGISGETARDQTAPFAVAAVQGTAPNFAGISHWFNSAPLNLADLRGRVVLVDFWTYGCVNCVNTLPHVTELYAKYKDRGLVVVGVHTPEFPFERSASNVQAALKRHGITYPVAQDNEQQTWNAYRNQYLPGQYIVDRNGKIVFQHDGQGQYQQMDRTIARLLNASS